MQQLLTILFSVLISISSFGQSDWQKKGIKIPPPVCYGSGHSHQHYTPPPEEFLKRLKSTAGLKSNIEVEYIGFSEEAQTAFQKAVEIWESLIYSPVTIHMVAYWSSLDEGVLGSCGPSIYYENFDAAQYKDCYYPVALVEKMQGEEITGPEIPDMIAQFNKDNQDWYFGVDGNTPADKYDFVSIVLHEIAHGLGFTGMFYAQSRQGAYGAELDFPGVFDELVADANKNLLLDTVLYKNPSSDLYDAFRGDSLFHLSATAKNKDENNRFARLWSPNLFDEGSSIYHLDEFYYSVEDTNALMTPYADEGEAIHNPGPLTLGIFADMGWKFISIKHDEILDRENTIDPISIQATVFSDEELDSTSIRMIYTRTEFEDDSTVLDLVYDEAIEKFTVDFTDLVDGQVKYYLEAKDINGITYRLPGVAPEEFLDFNLGPDTVKPTIVHSPIKSMLESNLSTEVVADVKDNIGVETVEVEYSINDGNTQVLELTLDSLSIYSTVFNFSGLTDGDSISYRIKATDNTSNSNIAYLPQDGYFTIYIDGTFEPVVSYFNNFNSFTRDFIISDFFIGTEPGFDDGALHSPHPYPSPDQEETTYEFTAILKYPITIRNKGVITFKEVVLVEPGEPNTVYGDEEFWDYVVIEGSKNGIDEWHPLIDGYDSRANSSWLQLYNQTVNGNNSVAIGNKNLYVQRKFYLNDNEFFDVGESIFIRFRLFSDPFAHGWGWAIDDLSIQDPLTSTLSFDYSPREITMFPNPFDTELNIQANFRKKVGQLTIKVMNSSGFEMRNKNISVNENILNEKMDVHSLSPGLYLVILSFDNGQTITQKLIKK
ncbi:T9SS type A sorting domain-containing protein [Sunxiuqinia sp. A32]|uniref:T9SS type A sorting domain-containing protein n=1 Tax=Sunxiuqinia sp. A32 TaxID=3461496 RepID=UPI004046550A